MVPLLPLAAAQLFAAAGGSTHQVELEESETVVYFGDPQIGFGRSGWQEDELRFASAARAASNASAVVIAGDLVNVWDNATLTGGFDKVWPSMFDRQRVHLVPGNHDVNGDGGNSSTFLGQLGHYRTTFGVDYHSFETQYATFVMINSETMILPELGLNCTGSAASQRCCAGSQCAALDKYIANETEAQWAWLEATLKAAQSAKPHTILVSHHPPFLKSASEAHVYWNWPPGVRNRLLGLLSKYGVHDLLCGHTHTTTNRTVDGFSIYTVAGTARAFDQNGCGVQVLTINSTTVDLEYVRQDDPSLKQCTPSLTHPVSCHDISSPASDLRCLLPKV